ncbi:MAG TPA: hypothetical protein VGN35_13005 [Jatrophihabitantaceae bacterium]|nr:hypothetical protein [Jatrophihabitantaceae bacterium]
MVRRLASKVARTRGSALVGLMPRRRRNKPGTLRTADSADLAHLTEFVRMQPGVEAYIEPRTAVTDTTVVLVAATGEWTRRRVPGPDAAQAFARKHAIPLYDVAVVGYPKRMREWTAQRKESARTHQQDPDTPTRP